MASVSKRVRDGRTTYVVRWRDDAGAQRKRSFTRKVDADRYRTEQEHSLNTGAYINPTAGKVTFKEYAEQWRKLQPHRPNTVRDVQSRLTYHAYPVLGSKPIAAIRTSDVAAFAAGLSTTLRSSSVRTVMTTVTAVFRAAVHDRLIVANPVSGVKLPSVERRQIVPLSAEQVYAIAERLPDRFAAIAVVGAGTGLRPGELFGLQVADVDFLRGTLRVERQAQASRGGGAAVCAPKNRNAYRTIPIGRVVVAELADHLRRNPASGTAFVFSDEDGAPLRHDGFTRVYWRPAVKAAGLVGTGMHQLRHAYASALIGAGQSVKVVSERLGHSNAAMTLNVYAHLWPADDDRSRKAVDDAFSAVAPRRRPQDHDTRIQKQVGG